MSMAEARSEIRERRKRRERTASKPKKRIFVRYKYNHYKWVETEDTGTFRELYYKYLGKFQYWCGDIPPELSAEGSYAGYRLDGPDEKISESLKRYGNHRAWIDSRFTVDGKPVILVYNAWERREE